MEDRITGNSTVSPDSIQQALGAQAGQAAQIGAVLTSDGLGAYNVKITNTTTTCGNCIHSYTANGLLMCSKTGCGTMPLCSCSMCQPKTYVDITPDVNDFQRRQTGGSFKAEEGKKYDQGKLAWHLLPWEELEEAIEVLMYGAYTKQYGEHNWQSLDPQRLADALQRHIAARWKGEVIDPESGHSHLSHALCNCLFLMWHDAHPTRPEEEKDD